MKKLLSAILATLLVVAAVFTLVACTDPDSGDDGNITHKYGEKDTTISGNQYKVDLDGHNLYLVNIGQGSAMSTVKNLLTDLGLQEGQDFLADTATKSYTAADVAAGDTVIVAVKASSKGMGDAGTDAATEEARAKAFADKAGINLIVMQVDGKSSRGTDDPLYKALCPKALVTMIVVGTKDDSSADYDGKFSNDWCKDTALFAYTRASKMSDSLKFILGVE